MTKIIYEPSIFMVGATVFRGPSAKAFFDKNGIEAGEGTPAKRFIKWDGYYEQDLIEFAGRMCYQSWEKGRNQKDFIRHILEVGHGNLLAHVNVTLAISGVSRSLSHELIRHHVGTNPSQESQRYVTQDDCNMVAHPLDLLYPEELEKSVKLFEEALRVYQSKRLAYKILLNDTKLPATEKRKRAHEAARGVLPGNAETKICWTMNLRAARNILEQRGGIDADLEIRRLAVAFLRLLQPIYPDVFADFTIEKDELGFEFLKFKYRKV